MKYRFLIVDTDHKVYGTNNTKEAFEQSKWDDIAVIDTATSQWVRKTLKTGVGEIKGWKEDGDLKATVGENNVYVVRHFNLDENTESYVEKLAFIRVSNDIYKLISLTSQNRWSDKEYKTGDVVDLEEQFRHLSSKFSITVETPYQ